MYDEWQQSAFSNEAVQPLAKRDRESCQSCHMPAAAGIASHRWPGANTHVPAFYGLPNQIKAVTDLLQSNILSVDIFPSIEFPKTSETLNPMTVDVVVTNRNVGHAFPAELRDIFEAWLEVKAVDASGRVLLHSGAVRPDGTLEPEAHAYRSVPIDERGDPVVRHDIWNTRVTAFDRHIPAGRADLGRFTIPIPADAKGPVTVTATVNYRRFNKRFLDWVERETAVGASPVVEIARSEFRSSEFTLERVSFSSGREPNTSHGVQSWRAYGIALLDQQRYEAAAVAFETALEGTKDETLRTNLHIDLGAAHLRMERTGGAFVGLDKADQALGRALAVSPDHPRARFLRALVNLKRLRFTEALTDLERLAREYPRDRHVRLRLGELYLALNRRAEAETIYKQILDIDPDEREAHFKLAGLYRRAGRYEAADYVREKFLPYHDDVEAETARRTYLRAHPELFRTWLWREFGDNPIGSP